MKERRTVEIDGDDFEVKGVGNWFIETDRKRYTWDEGEFNYSPDRIYPQGVKEGTVGLLSNRTARDIVLLTLGKCTAGTCWITWSDGMRALYNAPLIEDVSAFYAARSGEEAQAILRGMASVPGRIDDLGRKVEADGNKTRKQNHAEHKKTRVAAVDAVLEKRTRGGQKKEQEARVQEALDKMAVLIREKEMSPEDAADKVWGDYRDKGEPLGIKAHTLANRYRKERGPKPRPRNPKNLP